MRYSRLIFVCRCGQSAAQNVVFTLPKKPCCLVFSCSKSIPGAGRAKLLKSKYRGDVFMCLWSTPKADGWEMRSQRIRQRPAGGSPGSWSAFRVYLSINIQELSGTKFNPCHGKTNGDSVNLRCSATVGEQRKKAHEENMTCLQHLQRKPDWVS